MTPSPVTFVVSRIVKPSCEEAFEAWQRGIAAACLKYEGHLGVDLIRPEDHHRPEFVVILRFDSYDHLKRWVDSDERRKWLAEVDALTVGETRAEIVTGLEFWFELHDNPSLMPPRYKQALLTWAAITPLSIAANALLGPPLAALPLIVRSMIIAAILVILMTYVVMPRFTRLVARWLYAR